MENQNNPKYLEDIRLQVKLYFEFLMCPLQIVVNYQLKLLNYQVLRILDNIEIAPGTQIHTGQIGTSLIPDAMDVSTEDIALSGKASMDTTGAGLSQQAENDVRPEEHGDRKEHPSEYYSSVKSSANSQLMDETL